MSRTDTLAPVDSDLLASLEQACVAVGGRATDRLAGAHDASKGLSVHAGAIVNAPVAEALDLHWASVASVLD